MKFKIKDPGSAITHFIGCVMAITAAAPLLIKAAREPGSIYIIAMSIFILSMILLYAASTIYHTVDSTEKVNRRLRKMDHMMIFVMIAGSYTPVCLIALEGRTGTILCALVWAVAILGILIKALWITCPKWFSSVIYIGMGWLCVLAAFPFAICGFFTYNGMTFERFLIAVIRSELLYPRHLVFKSDNLYAKLMEHTSMKEDLKLD